MFLFIAVSSWEPGWPVVCPTQVSMTSSLSPPNGDPACRGFILTVVDLWVVSVLQRISLSSHEGVSVTDQGFYSMSVLLVLKICLLASFPTVRPWPETLHIPLESATTSGWRESLSTQTPPYAQTPPSSLRLWVWTGLVLVWFFNKTCKPYV